MKAATSKKSTTKNPQPVAKKMPVITEWITVSKNITGAHFSFTTDAKTTKKLKEIISKYGEENYTFYVRMTKGKPQVYVKLTDKTMLPSVSKILMLKSLLLPTKPGEYVALKDANGLNLCSYNLEVRKTSEHFN